MSESLYHNVAGLYPTTLMKQNTQEQMFSDEFCEIFKNIFLRNTSWRMLLLYRQIFYEENSKKSLKKRIKMETAIKKNNETRRNENLNTT